MRRICQVCGVEYEEAEHQDGLPGTCSFPCWSVLYCGEPEEVHFEDLVSL